MNKLIVLFLMCFLIPAQAEINPTTGVDFAIENDAYAIDILVHKSRKARVAAAVHFFIDVLYKGQCNKTNAGKPYRMWSNEVGEVVTILCGSQELVQLEVKEGSSFTEMKIRFVHENDDFGEWKSISAVFEIVEFWPQLSSNKFKEELETSSANPAPAGSVK